MSTQRKNDLLRQGSILAVAGILVRLIGILYRIPMSNLLGDVGNGIYSVAYGIYGVTLTLASSSLPLAVSKLIAQRSIQKQHQNAYRLFRIALIFALIVGAAAALFLFFGSFIKEQRQELGLSQKELAEKLYITDKAVSKWETGRGLPDIASLEPLSNALNVSVSEILNGEKSQNNESEIDNAKLLKKLKIKKYIRLAAEIVITIVYAYWLYIFKDTFKGFQNVLDLALHKNEIELLSVFTLIFIFLFVLWLIVEIITTIINKKGSVIKAVIICLSVCFVIGASLKMADMENSRSIELYDEPIKTVSYINYDDFFNDKFTTQIRINDTNEYITKNYAAMFDGTDSENNLLYTKCVAASKTDIAKAYYNEKKKYYENKDKYYTCTSDYCKAANFDEGFYVLDNYGNNDFELIFIRGNEVFDVNITQTNINDEKFIKAIKDIK